MLDPGHPLFKGVYDEEIKTLTAAAGFNTLAAATVPDGEIWVVQNADTQNATSGGSNHQLGVSGAGVGITLKQTVNVNAGIVPTWAGEIVLAAGSAVFCFFSGVTLNDHLYLHVRGYKMYV